MIKHRLRIALVIKKIVRTLIEYRLEIVLVITFLILLTLSSIFVYKYFNFINYIPEFVDIKIDCDSKLIYNNHVGNDWNTTVYINKKKFNARENIYKLNKNESIDVVALIEESDKIPDNRGDAIAIDMQILDYKSENTFTIPITVIENRGRYSGNSAKWEVQIKLKRYYTFWDIIAS